MGIIVIFVENTGKMKAYIDQHRERFFDELFSLLRIPSISAKPEY